MVQLPLYCSRKSSPSIRRPLSDHTKFIRPCQEMFGIGTGPSVIPITSRTAHRDLIAVLRPRTTRLAAGNCPVGYPVPLGNKE